MDYKVLRTLAHAGRVYKAGESITDLPDSDRLKRWMENGVVARVALTPEDDPPKVDDPPKDDPAKDDPPKDDPAKDDPPKDEPPKDVLPKDDPQKVDIPPAGGDEQNVLPRGRTKRPK